MLGSDMFSRYSGNLKLLKKKRYFRQHQGVSEIDISTNQENPKEQKKLTRKELLKIKEDMRVEERKELDRKVLILILAIILTVVLISLVVYLIRFIPEEFLDFPSSKKG